jgi:phage baseplate assembly protein V
MATFSTEELDIHRYLEGMVRVGRVTKVSTDNRIAATVTYPDRGFQSGYLNVLQKNTIGTQEFYVPVEGEPVWVLQLPRSQGRGVILGSCYTVGNPPPYNSASIRGIVFGDGSYVIYDTAGGGNYQINVAGKVTLTSAGDTIANVSGALTATVNGTASITAAHIELHGPTKVFGTLECTGVFTADVGGIAIGHITNTDGSGGGA